ncbi:hypothetical protein GCM10027033_27640 [Leucobacter ruminantium]|uniref:Glycosyltransferase n=1 Tax=Leucobacter ruminantium TaxID=1289170 RepID=A0A939LWP0_9MICO|nr:glycosyltransferase [Leucobacter ruminantium]MBO1806095.1 glycosyltransferase [Leucobacter ruminantium]
MRYVLAIAALVLSGVMLLLGIGQRTFLAGPAEITYEASLEKDAHYAVISGEELAKVPGQANIVVGGEDAFAATGSAIDVGAWVATFDHVALAADTGTRALESTAVPASAPAEDGADARAEDGSEPPADTTDPADAEQTDPGAAEPEWLDPRGSDLWLQEKALSGDAEEVRMPVKLAEDQAVLVAADGERALAGPVSIVWVQDRSTPWAGPLLVSGGILALVGAVLYILAVDHDRRGLGPRRGRKGPLQGIRNSFSRKRRSVAPSTEGGSARVDRRIAVPALGLAVALGLSGCSANYWPQFGESAPQATTEAPAPQNGAPIPVTEAQLDRIVARVSKVAGDADEKLSAEVLRERFTGDALAQREANYKIRASVPDYGVTPPHITDQALDYELVQSTESWPRTIFVTAASTKGGAEKGSEEEASPSLAMVLTQETPHDNFLVSRIVALRGGISMPQAAPAEEGTALLAEDLESLVLQPGEVGTAFASVLQNGEASEHFELFDLGTDKLLENYGKARVDQAAAQATEAGTPMTFSMSARQGDQDPVALSTGVGGALVATTVIEEQVVESGGGRYKPEAVGVVTALSGLSGQQDRIVQEIAHQMLFFVPSKAEEGAKIQLLGETSELVGVRN